MTKDILLKFERFTIIANSFDYLSSMYLHELYLPLIGVNSVLLYENLFNSAKIESISNIQNNSIENLLFKLNFSIDTLEESFNYLESVGLIQSYIESSSTEPKIIFVLKNSLNYDDFMSNETLKSLLKKRLGSTNFSLLNYKFNSYLIDKNLNNISNDISWLINKKDNLKINELLDFSELQQKILFLSSKKIIFNDSDKKIISNYYNNEPISQHELINILTSSLEDDGNNIFVNFNIFKNEIEQFKNAIDNSIDIIRNPKLFALNQSLDELTNVIESYKNNNSENYILFVTKNYLSSEMKRVIDLLRKKFHFSDEIINLLVDYCLFKNIGRLEHNYIYKIAQTLNNMNINNDLSKAIIYLQYVSNNIKPTYNSLIKIKPILENTTNNNELNIDDIWA